MHAFRLTPDQAMLFFEICQELHADTEKERIAILKIMAEYKQVESITETKKTKDEYIKGLAKHFENIAVVESNGSIKSITLDDQPKGDTNGGSTK